ncbi:MAG: hypothetical protein MZV63_06600, partial [Marinilabiliales bacterium]|nr:hypothetical protein [Marinilabiliales bacterium]
CFVQDLRIAKVNTKTPTTFFNTSNSRRTKIGVIVLLVMYIEAYLKTDIQSGRITDSEGRNHKIKLLNKTKILLPILNSLREWLISPPLQMRHP